MIRANSEARTKKDADRIRGAREIGQTGLDNINSGETPDINGDIARGDYDSAERRTREVVRDRN